MKPEGSLPHSQVPATCPYPELQVATTYHVRRNHIKLYTFILNDWYLNFTFLVQYSHLKLMKCNVKIIQMTRIWYDLRLSKQ